jgi:hypothetical protein
MHLYFKIRNIDNLSLDNQKELITDYVAQRAGFLKYGAKLKGFIVNESVGNPFTPPHVIAHFYLPPEADFTKIQNKITVYALHDAFIILACVV